MALARKALLRGGSGGGLWARLRAMQATNAELQCRGMVTFSVDDMVKKIMAMGDTKKATAAHLLPVEGSKPYDLINKHSEYAANYVIRPLDRKLKRKQIFIELTKAWQTKTLVDGSVLNVVRGGYAVALGGFVAFMPRSLRKTSNVHSKFYVINIKDNNSLVVGEADGTAMSWSRLFRFYKRSLQRLNMTVWLKGTVVARAKDGYCVAIAGHIAYLPKAYRKSRKLESTFRIVAMYPRTGKIEVHEVNTKYFASLLSPQEQHQQEQDEQSEGEEAEQDEEQQGDEDDDAGEGETVRS